MGRSSGAKSSYGGSQSGYNSKSMMGGLSSSMMAGSSSTKAAVNSMENEIHQQLLQEIEKLTKEKKASQKEHSKELAAKNTKINNVLTDFENTKTDL